MTRMMLCLEPRLRPWALAVALAAVLLGLVAQLASAFYTPDVDVPLEDWNAEEVQHWLVSVGLTSIVHQAHTQRIDGAVLKRMLETEEIPHDLGLSTVQEMKFKLDLENLAGKIRLYESPEEDLGNKPYLHPCQILSTSDCQPSFGTHQLGLLFFPRITALFSGVDGTPLSHMPWSYFLTWMLAPHSAYFAYGLDAYGLSLSNVISHAMRITAAAFGPIADAAIVQFLCGVAGVHVSREVFQQLHTYPVFALHAVRLLGLCLDLLSGWYIGTFRLLIAARDIFIVVFPALKFFAQHANQHLHKE